MKKEITSDAAPPAAGPYSLAVESDGFVFVSGLIPTDRNGAPVPKTVAMQTAKTMDNVSAVLKSAGLTMNDVVKTTIYLTDMESFAAMNEVYSSYFSKPYPARACIGVSSLPKGVSVMIDAIARR